MDGSGEPWTVIVVADSSSSSRGLRLFLCSVDCEGGLPKNDLDHEVRRLSVLVVGRSGDGMVGGGSKTGRAKAGEVGRSGGEVRERWRWSSRTRVAERRVSRR